MRKSILYIAVLIVSISILNADDIGGDPGKFMLLGQMPRAIARGQSMTASPEIEAFSYNPASLLGIEDYQAAASYQFLALDRTIYSAVFGGNIRNDAAFALSWTHGGVDIQGRDNDGEVSGTLRNGMENIALAFSKKVYKGFAAGVSVRYYQERLSEISTYTAGFDIGISHYIRKFNLRYAATVQNLQMSNSWDSSELYADGYSTDEEFPITFRFGAYWDMKFIPVNISTDVVYTDNRDIRYHFGASYHIIEQISIHAGLDHNLPTGGISLNLPISESLNLSADYAISSERWDLPMKHIIGIRGTFESQKK